MTEEELDQILRQFRKDRAARQPKRCKRARCRTGLSNPTGFGSAVESVDSSRMEQLVNCIERQLDAYEKQERRNDV